eukprot:CAMPEP_0170601028 /NCGR_PEP_ID=MMETSP0224-20130122/17641_1 /TAXON_ID=285029 /ORGANISM="Togula jolla, Strain CCCM 725" /LENGTH=353 /DNA_ID=CAMNT_0010925777 /DNA_START=33 /DNA_END=1094 /DNA_ORIENTATION=-
MDTNERRSLVELCMSRFPLAGFPNFDAASITGIRSRQVARLWGGMGSIFDLRVSTQSTEDVVFVAKQIRLPENCTKIGDLRKKHSYDVEAAFYSNGHAERLIKAGCRLPFPLLVDHSRENGLTICMTKLQGEPGCLDEEQTKAALSWLARLHATYWGPRADLAVEQGLQPQGTYWYLDTRPDELAAMPTRGWEGRLRLAARALDLRLKAEPMQTIVHGDAKGANMLFAEEGGRLVAMMYDFQYCGKAPPTKDLAYLFTCARLAPDAEERLLKFYHHEVSSVLERKDVQPTLEGLQAALALSYCDLGRWMIGWGFRRVDFKDKIQAVLDKLDGGKMLASEEAYIDAVRREFPLD